MQETAPLLGTARQRFSLRTKAAASAVLLGCVVLAIGAYTAAPSLPSPVVALQKDRPHYVAQLAPAQAAQPVVYLPISPQQGLAAAPATVVQPQVFYYAPASTPGMKIYLGQALNETGNATANSTEDGGGDDGEFSCAVSSLVAESAKVQAEWDKCLKNPRYEQPNKDAGRRLLGWVWEPESAQKQAARGSWVWEPKARRARYQLALRQSILAGNDTNSTEGEGGGDGDSLTDPHDYRSMSECMQEAIGDACENLDDCDDSVCTHYYNEPEIEALCGMCGMAAANDWGPFGSWRSVELWLVLIIFLTVVISVPIIICECCYRRRRTKQVQ